MGHVARPPSTRRGCPPITAAGAEWTSVPAAAAGALKSASQPPGSGLSWGAVPAGVSAPPAAPHRNPAQRAAHGSAPGRDARRGHRAPEARGRGAGRLGRHGEEGAGGGQGGSAPMACTTRGRGRNPRPKCVQTRAKRPASCGPAVLVPWPRRVGCARNGPWAVAGCPHLQVLCDQPEPIRDVPGTQPFAEFESALSKFMVHAVLGPMGKRGRLWLEMWLNHCQMRPLRSTHSAERLWVCSACASPPCAARWPPLSALSWSTTCFTKLARPSSWGKWASS